MIDEYSFLTEKQFNELDDNSKWNYIKSLKTIIDDLGVHAEKNCSACEQYYLEPGDLNIKMLFEDWRSCAEHCDECGKEERVNMCALQFQLMSHIAEEVASLRNKFTGMIKYVLTKDDAGKKLVEDTLKDAEAKRISPDGLYG